MRFQLLIILFISFLNIQAQESNHEFKIEYKNGISYLKKNDKIIEIAKYPDFFYFLEHRNLLFKIKSDTLFSVYSYSEEMNYKFNYNSVSKSYSYVDENWRMGARCTFYLKKFSRSDYILGASFTERVYIKPGETQFPAGQQKVGVFNSFNGTWGVNPSYDFIKIFKNHYFGFKNLYIEKPSFDSTLEARYIDVFKSDDSISLIHHRIIDNDVSILQSITQFDSITKNSHGNYKIFVDDQTQMVDFKLDYYSANIESLTELNSNVKGTVKNGIYEITKDSLLIGNTRYLLSSIPYYKNIDSSPFNNCNCCTIENENFKINDTLLVINSYKPPCLSDVPLVNNYGEDSVIVLNNKSIVVYPRPKGLFLSQLIDIKSKTIILKDMARIYVEDGFNPIVVAEYYPLDEFGVIKGELLKKRYNFNQ